jgi:hypothetical protein
MDERDNLQELANAVDEVALEANIAVLRHESRTVGGSVSIEEAEREWARRRALAAEDAEHRRAFADDIAVFGSVKAAQAARIARMPEHVRAIAEWEPVIDEAWLEAQ